MGTACRAHGRDKKLVRNWSGVECRKLRVDWRTISKRMLKKEGDNNVEGIRTQNREQRLAVVETVMNLQAT
jgi:hypothetical protein